MGLFVSEQESIRIIEDFTCHLLKLSGGRTCHFTEGFLPCRCDAEIEHRFGHSEGAVFLVLRRDGELSAELFKRMSESAFGERDIP